MTTAIAQLLDGHQATVRDFGLEFAQLIAKLAVDPHGYFEKKYTARIEQARTDQEISGVIAQLVQWVVSSAISDDQRAALDRELGAQGWPCIDDLRVHLLP